MKVLFKLCLIIFLSSCSSSTESDEIGPCETVINAHGPGFFKVINNLNKHIEVFLPEYAFGANMRPKVCEIFGLATGVRRVEISLCTDDRCDSYSDTKNESITIEDGKTHTIEVTDSYFTH